MAAKKPQDYKSAGEFVFHVKSKRYTLPPVTEVELPGSDLMDSMLDGKAGQLSYLFRKLKATGRDDAISALRKLPEAEMLEVIKDWGEFGDGDGESLGE